MLASTMQFSNNQHSRKQPRSLRTQQRAQPGQTPSPSTPKQY
jgi:hypothetical protein